MIIKDICNFCIHETVCSRKQYLKDLVSDLQLITNEHDEKDMVVEIQCDKFDMRHPSNPYCVG